MKNEIQKNHIKARSNRTAADRNTLGLGTHHRKIITKAAEAAGRQIAHPDAAALIARAMAAFGSRTATVTA